MFLQIDFPFTHNLNQLRDLLPEGWSVKEDYPDLARLSVWAVEPRYPGDLIEATREDAEDAVEQAGSIYETTLEDLERHGYDPDNGEERQKRADDDEEDA